MGRRGTRTLLCAMVVALTLLTPSVSVAATEDTYSGSDMWLHYVPVSDPALLAQYRASATTIVVDNADQNKVYRNTANLRMEAGSAEKLVETSMSPPPVPAPRGTCRSSSTATSWWRGRSRRWGSTASRSTWSTPTTSI